ncbi:MAG: cystathionine gamma-synthase [Anaerolineales bacterium]|nr:cystathionine gamma-synthase [Anaerolineales bacterium]MCW5856151.1 cystathionine gamma-synthase [Anaerolineales bacterium]
MFCGGHMPDHFETLAIHAGQPADPQTGAVMTPIYQTSTYAQPRVGEHKGYEYSRTGNPTRTALQDCLAALEGAAHGLAFGSGLAATDTIIRTLSPGDEVLVGGDVYGGTFRLFDKEYRRFGLVFRYMDATDPAAVDAALSDKTRMVWLETPTNPYLRLADLAAIAELLKQRPNAPLLVVDNTFASPYLQQPLKLGADIVLHSATKYLGGHSDSVLGLIALNDQTLAERLAFLQNAAGAVPGPMDCFLILRGLKTLHLRMDRHAANAQAVAAFLADHPKVSQLYYPFHSSHPQQALARRQMRNGGGMVSFEIAGGEAAARKMVERTRIFTLAESLGGVESLIEVPAAMTHLSTAGSPLEVSPSLVRLSVGLEHVDDLITDLEQALS